MSKTRTNPSSRAARNNRAAKPRRRISKTRYAVPQMMGAPAGVSQDLQQFCRFYPGRSSQTIKMHTCAPIAQVLRESTAASDGALQLESFVGMSTQLNLTEPVILGTGGGAVVDSYLSPVWDLIASAFTRYRVKKLVFHYEPQASATTTERMVFAFAPDPVHPILWSNPAPTQTDLLALSDSIAFAPWRGWSMDVTSKLVDNLYYTFTDPTASVSTFADRFSDFGVISLVGATPSQAAIIGCGILYMETEIELEEFCPIVNASPAAFSLLSRKAPLSISRQPVADPRRGGFSEPPPSSKEDEPTKETKPHEGTCEVCPRKFIFK